jgi:hypothetical protein
MRSLFEVATAFVDFDQPTDSIYKNVVFVPASLCRQELDDAIVIFLAL